MISVEHFCNFLGNAGVDFYTGVPDSLLKDLSAYLEDNMVSDKHVISANEGGAVGLALGHYLSTGETPVVYLQNSGFGNTVNPILSLADNQVYGVPMILVIGWRGEPGVKDEPQHVKQGAVNEAMLKSMNIPYQVLSTDSEQANIQISTLKAEAESKQTPVALLVRKNTFESYKLQKLTSSKSPLTREDSIQTIAKSLSRDTIVVSTTGKASRELYEYRDASSDSHERDFLTVGGMGHASQIALGIALNKQDRLVACIDGDGAALMHLGSMPIIGCSKVKNYIHFVLNNGAHDSVGGQPTVGQEIDFCGIAKASGYGYISSVSDANNLEETIKSALKNLAKPAFIEVNISIGARSDLGRPRIAPSDNKVNFMKFVQNGTD